MDKIRLFMKKLTLLLITTSLILTGCGIYKHSPIKDNPVNVNQRVQKNIEEGRGIRFGKGASKGGVFDFASSNELWRASIEILDFVHDGQLLVVPLVARLVEQQRPTQRRPVLLQPTEKTG